MRQRRWLERKKGARNREIKKNLHERLVVVRGELVQIEFTWKRMLDVNSEWKRLLFTSGTDPALLEEANGK